MTVDFKQLQYHFAEHIRNPEHAPAPPNVEDRRMAIYRELFFNNIEGFISGAFPVLRKFYSTEHWHALVRQFMVHYRARTPYFLKISEEFLHYLNHQHTLGEHDPDFMLELAHYEWTELALTVLDEDNDLNSINPNGDLMQGAPVVSNLAWRLSYQYPVHTLSADTHPIHLPAPEHATHLMVYRDRTDQIRFAELNAVTAALFELLEQTPNTTGEQACQQLITLMQHPNPDVVYQGGQATLNDLRAKGVILGTRISN